MSEQTVRSILRLVAIFTILVGVILTTMSVFEWAAVGRSMHDAMRMAHDAGVNFPDRTADLALWSLAAQVVIIIEGLLLFAMSPALARKVVQ